MKVLIVEDEELAAERLKSLLLRHDPSIETYPRLDTVKEAVPFIAQHSAQIDLILLDIQLADGRSFEIFNHIEVSIPIIFVTAYDEYALDAFKVNSIDYLMKPVRFEELTRALEKFGRMGGPKPTIDPGSLTRLIGRPFKSRFLVKAGQRMFFKHLQDIAYFYAEDKLCYLVEQTEGKKFLVDHTLEQLDSVLNPSEFFRINRSVIIHITAVQEIRKYDSSRYQVSMNGSKNPFIISRTKTAEFKEWLEDE